MADTLPAVHFGKAYVARPRKHWTMERDSQYGAMSIVLCGASSPTDSGSVGLMHTTSWLLVDCEACLARKPTL